MFVYACGLPVFVDAGIEIRCWRHLLESLVYSKGSITLIVGSSFFYSTDICLASTLGLPLLLILKM